MSDLHLHIISFDIPYPPNYGGVIDVYYKLVALHKAGVMIHLHCFEYHREPAPELERICFSIHYYKRKADLFSALNWKPYIVYSRRSKKLLETLCQDSYPILFEGLHSCYFISHPALRDRIKIYRESNIEHQYYYHLSIAETNPFRKLFFFLSGLKLRVFQPVLRHSNLMLTVSREDNEYLTGKFPNVAVEYLPSFHKDDEVTIVPGKGDYILYQGNLGVAENTLAASYLVSKVFGGTELKFRIAGLNPPESLIRLVSKHPNITLIPDPGEEEMKRLIQEAHINVMVTFQATGLKLKLLNALFSGRYCLVNEAMITGTELGPLCEIAGSPESIRATAGGLMDMSFPEEEISRRRELLMKWHSNQENCKALLNYLSLLSK